MTAGKACARCDRLETAWRAVSPDKELAQAILDAWNLAEPKPFCPCDAGRPQDCKPEEWGFAHKARGFAELAAFVVAARAAQSDRATDG